MSEIVLFKSEEPSSRQAAAEFLRNLADKVEAGRVVLKQGDTETVLEPTEKLTLEIKAEQKEKPGKPTKLQLEVELEWYPDQPDSGVELG